MLQSLMTERRLILTGVVVVCVTVTLTLGSIRAYAIYRLTTEQALLQSRFDVLVAQEDSRDKTLRDELDSIERTLYTQPTLVPLTPSRKESSVEQWMLDHDKELRERITALERWRLQTEKR